MNGLNRFQAGDPFWAWAVAGGDGDDELAKAIGLYRERFGCRPFLVICPDGLKLKPVSGLTIVPHPLVSLRTFYFALRTA